MNDQRTRAIFLRCPECGRGEWITLADNGATATPEEVARWPKQHERDYKHMTSPEYSVTRAIGMDDLGTELETYVATLATSQKAE